MQDGVQEVVYSLYRTKRGLTAALGKALGVPVGLSAGNAVIAVALYYGVSEPYVSILGILGLLVFFLAFSFLGWFYGEMDELEYEEIAESKRLMITQVSVCEERKGRVLFRLELEDGGIVNACSFSLVAKYIFAASEEERTVKVFQHKDGKWYLARSNFSE